MTVGVGISTSSFPFRPDRGGPATEGDPCFRADLVAVVEVSDRAADSL